MLAERLQEAIKELTRVPAVGHIPICGYLLGEDVEGRLALTATDMQTTLTAHVGAQVNKSLRFTVPKRELAKVAGRWPDGTVSISGEGRNVTFATKRGSLTLEGPGPDDYPPTPTAPQMGTVDGAAFADRLRRAVVCAVDDDSRPVLNGVHIHADADEMRVEASDGYRLARFLLPYTGKPFQCILPISTVKVMQRLAVRRSVSDEIVVHWRDQAVAFLMRDYTITAMPVQATFPDVNRLIPDKHEHRIAARVADLLTEIETAHVLAADGKDIIRFVVAPDAVAVSGKSEGKGTYQGTVAAQTEIGTASQPRIAANGVLLIEILKTMGKDNTVTVAWESSARQMVITEEPGTAGFYILMPMLAQW